MRRTLLLATAVLLGAPLGAAAQSEAPVVEACVGPTGGLRLAGEGCRPREHPFAWQRGGGAWVHDAEGRPLGRSLSRSLGGVRIYLDGSGLRVALETFGGRLFPRFSSILFRELDCQGTAFGSSSYVAGDVIVESSVGPLFVGTERVEPSVTALSELFSGRCRNLSAPRIFGPLRELVPFDERMLGFELPVALPLGFGTGPLGEVSEELVHACAGARGQLRLAEAPDACSPAERPLAWQRLGGLRVYDGAGRDVGAALGTLAPLPEDGILLPAAGVWIEPDPLSGALREPDLRRYAEPNCQGPSFAATFFFPPFAGQVFSDPSPGAFVVTTSEHVQDEPFQSFRSGSCHNSAGVDSGLRLAPYTGPLPELPLPLPLVVGFPGSPIANPGGPAIAAGLLHACAGPDGQLRVREEGEPCRPSERALRWSRRGGLRALDAHGQELGAFLENPYSNVIDETMRIIDDTSGLRFGVEFHFGRLGDDQAVVPVELSFTGRLCGGTAFRFNEARVGLVFPFESRLLVGTRLEALVQRSARTPFTICTQRTLFPEPFLSTVVEDFTGVLPFALPVATPLGVGPGN